MERCAYYSRCRPGFNVIKINFSKAKEIGADYVISKFPISNNLLKPVCINCNNSSNLFLYKINPV